MYSDGGRGDDGGRGAKYRGTGATEAEERKRASQSMNETNYTLYCDARQSPESIHLRRCMNELSTRQMNCKQSTCMLWFWRLRRMIVLVTTRHTSEPKEDDSRLIYIDERQREPFKTYSILNIESLI